MAYPSSGSCVRLQGGWKSIQGSPLCTHNLTFFPSSHLLEWGKQYKIKAKSKTSIDLSIYLSINLSLQEQSPPFLMTTPTTTEVQTMTSPLPPPCHPPPSSSPWRHYSLSCYVYVLPLLLLFFLPLLYYDNPGCSVYLLSRRIHWVFYHAEAITVVLVLVEEEDHPT